jgi:hypothetical protein
MKTIITLVLLTASVVAHALTPTQKLARAIAKAEGFGIKNSVSTRYHNPGDIRASHGVKYFGQIGINTRGYVIFKDDRAGWAALEGQIEKIITGASRFYNVNMTLAQISRSYATSSIWVKNVAKNLGVTPATWLFEILDVPPLVTVTMNVHDLDFLGETQ